MMEHARELDATVSARLRRSSTWLRTAESGGWRSLDFVDEFEGDLAPWLDAGWLERLALPHREIDAVTTTAAAYAGVNVEGGAWVVGLGMGPKYGFLTFAVSAETCEAWPTSLPMLGEDRGATFALPGLVLPAAAFQGEPGGGGWWTARLSAAGTAMSMELRRQALLIDVDPNGLDAEAALDLTVHADPVWRGKVSELAAAIAELGEGAR